LRKDTLKIFGETIKHFRNKFELTQEELAEKCGFHRTYVGQVERGERNPSLKNIYIFANSLNISTVELFKMFEHLKNHSE